MIDKKPENIAEYKKWLKEQHHVQVAMRMQNHYESVAAKIQGDFAGSPFWTILPDRLRQAHTDYMVRTGYLLLKNIALPELLTKPFDSFLLKTFRRNVLDNRNWPSEPEGGWVLPPNWFRQINDLIRTSFVVKYLDGVSFLAEAMQAVCADTNTDCSVDFEAKEEGYYAAHAYVSHTCQIPKENWDTQEVRVRIELQITTQVQEVIRTLLHKYYEKSRVQGPPEGLKWQWEYSSDEFAANYLGHILHYVEGMIMDIRKRQEGDTA